MKHLNEQDAVMHALEAETNTLRKHILLKLREFKLPTFAERSYEIERLTTSISELDYPSYRIFVGTINVLRRGDGQTWSMLKSYFKNFQTEVEDHPQLSSLLEICISLLNAEAARSLQDASSEYSDGPSPSVCSPYSLITQILFIARTIYPLGINILSPDWDERASSPHALTSGMRLMFYCPYTLITLSTHPVDHGRSGHQLIMKDPKRGIKQVRIHPGEHKLIGRTHLTFHTLFGLPLRERIPVHLKVKSSVWSRAALVFYCDAQGSLYVFDRASLNELRFNLFEERDGRSDSQLMSYRPDSLLLSEDPERRSSSVSHLFGITSTLQ